MLGSNSFNSHTNTAAAGAAAAAAARLELPSLSLSSQPQHATARARRPPRARRTEGNSHIRTFLEDTRKIPARSSSPKLLIKASSATFQVFLSRPMSTSSASLHLPSLLAHLRETLPQDKHAALDAACQDLQSAPEAVGSVRVP